MTRRTPPLGDQQGLWQAVMAAAAGRCQCRGTCGKNHDKDGGRCPAQHGAYVRHGTGPVHLLAAPAEADALLLPPHKAAALPKAALAAWCPACHSATRRAVDKARLASAPAAGPDCLFDF
ncbi:hypothetical protein ACIOJE_24895 [Kitasatospora sp. NPDC087861]|uniref:hypothetical protein n=1 Tax=Kitasatospora sp. NPDC087861 TaxID=3364070 RepID=UPI0037FA440B